VSVVLAVDTASSDIALAFAIDGHVAGSLVLDGSQDHSKLLLRAIDELLGPLRERLSAIVVTRGPGSYAGLRVGIATGQGLGFARGIAVRGIPTLESVTAASGLELVTAIHPAGRGEFAAQEFAHGVAAGPLRTTGADELRGLVIAGERAGAMGGMEISPEARCRAGLERSLRQLDGEDAASTGAIYLREPNITTPRRPAAGR
jgi:tRNA threonylcarbamoyl adenosine modification protein YeaZ